MLFLVFFQRLVWVLNKIVFEVLCAFLSERNVFQFLWKQAVKFGQDGVLIVFSVYAVGDHGYYPL